MTQVKKQVTGYLPLMLRKLGYAGVAFSVLCCCALLLAMTGVLPALGEQYGHQSDIRWLSEGAIGGMLLGAIGFWQAD